MLEWLDIPRSETPVLVHATNVMRNPSAAQVARSLGLRAEVDGERFDLVVLGAGPAGLAAAVYGGSEGLRTFVAEAWAPGGQAGTSTRIENYLGFPTGISGIELTRKATLQARRFDAVLSSFHRAVELADGPEGLVRVDLDDGQHVLARSVVMATGARWRELQAEGIDRFRGAGVYHAAMATDAERCRDEDVIVVGGGNSAGQAAVHLATRARSVRVVVRGKALKSTMSHYLVDRIERSHEHRGADRDRGHRGARHRDRRVGEPAQRRRQRPSRCRSTAVFVMIGAEPCTEATTGMLAVDPAGYLLCGTGAANCDGHLGWPLTDREPHLLETVRPGVFAAGDVRAGRVQPRRGRGRRRRDGRALRPRRAGRLTLACAARRAGVPSASSAERRRKGMREDIQFDAEGATLRGWFYRPDDAGAEVPCIVMSHGFSAIKEMHLDDYAEVFADAGLACVVFDNRGLGESDAAPGKPRGEIDPWEQIRDYQHAISYAQLRPEVDAARIGVWGSSYSAAHAYVVAAIDRRVKAVCGQVPLISGRRGVRDAGADRLLGADRRGVRRPTARPAPAARRRP